MPHCSCLTLCDPLEIIEMVNYPEIVEPFRVSFGSDLEKVLVASSSVAFMQRLSSILSSNEPSACAIACCSGIGGSATGNALMMDVFKFGIVVPTALLRIRS